PSPVFLPTGFVNWPNCLLSAAHNLPEPGRCNGHTMARCLIGPSLHWLLCLEKSASLVRVSVSAGITAVVVCRFPENAAPSAFLKAATRSRHAALLLAFLKCC